MKRVLPIVFVVTLMAGCQHPDEVHLTPGPDDAASQVEITRIAPADTGSASGVFDSSAVLPADRARFGGFLSLNRVVDDFVVGAVRQVRSREFASAIFTDRNQPVSIGMKVFGYYGIKLDTVRIDGLRLFQLTHLVPVPLVGNVAAGYEYVRGMAGDYIPGKNYQWTLNAGSNTARFAIQAPADLTVQSPLGGTVISRNRQLELRWRGSGNIAIVISEYFPLANKARPILSLKPALNTGRLILGPRILALLPAGRQYFVFTFVLYNRDEQRTLAGYPAEILMQASSVYNSFVELQ